MTNYSVGHQAEKVAAEYLTENGYKVLEMNWRTKYCEIDIVATKDKRVYFVEVKYRKSDAYGGGLDYILPRKLKQMRFAAEMWVSNNKWQGDYSLAALEVSGYDFKITNFLDDI